MGGVGWERETYLVRGVEWDGDLPPAAKCTTPAPPGTHLGEPWTLCGEGRMLRSTNLSPPKSIPKLNFLRLSPLSQEIRPGFTLEVCCVTAHLYHKSTQHRDTCPVWRAPNEPSALQKLQLLLAGNPTAPGKPGLSTDFYFIFFSTCPFIRPQMKDFSFFPEA